MWNVQVSLELSCCDRQTDGRTETNDRCGYSLDGWPQNSVYRTSVGLPVDCINNFARSTEHRRR